MGMIILSHGIYFLPLGVNKRMYTKFLVQCLAGMQFMWAFVTIIISQITFHSSGIFLPLPFSARYQVVSFCVSADQPNGRLHRCRAGQTSGSENQRTPWMKIPQGPAVLPSPVSSGSHGGKLAPLHPIHTEGCHRALVSPWKAQPSSGTLLILFLLSPVHPICSGPPGLGGPRRVSVADRGPLLGPFALTVTSPSCQDHWQA